MSCCRCWLSLLLILAAWMAPRPGAVGAEPNSGEPIDFNRHIRPILSNKCYFCHGPDESERQGGDDGIRLDTREGALADIDGYAAVVPGKPAASALVQRITSDDEFEVMPPPDSGSTLSADEIKLLTEWIRQGAPYAQHWSYVPPVRPPVPTVGDPSWPNNPIDAFLLRRMEKEGLQPSPRADRYTLIRRVALDLTGLPPTLEEVETFVNDKDPQAYERLVDRLLAKQAYGEHWARMWLDLARYADSAGYADDPPRTIWAFRDYVIRSLNTNKPFDQFTLEQIAGDLLDNPTPEQLIATAFHRNTLTNNEGGTNDEEFRNVAIVDRVNTTMAVWMGTTMACAQCHTHKYDPLTQEEYFKLFAILNSSADADRRDESPLLEVYTDQQKEQRRAWETELARLNEQLAASTPQLVAAQAEWEEKLAKEIAWQTLRPSQATAQSGASLTITDDGTVQAADTADQETYTLEFAAQPGKLAALRIEALPDAALPNGGPGLAGGNFVVSRVAAQLTPPDGAAPHAQFVRIELPGKEKILSLAEVEVFAGAENIAGRGKATQSSTDYEGAAARAIDGNTNGHYFDAKSTTHTATSDNPWWELDLGAERPIERLMIWNRSDGNVFTRLSDFRVVLLAADRTEIWSRQVEPPPKHSLELTPSGVRPIAFGQAVSDFDQKGFPAAAIIDNQDPAGKGWAVAPRFGQPHWLTLTPVKPVEIPAGSTLSVRIEHQSKHPRHSLGRFRVSISDDPQAIAAARRPAKIQAILQTPADERTPAEQDELAGYYRSIAPELAAARKERDKLAKQLADFKPATTVPIMRELPENKRRTTHIQRRGNYLEKGAEVTPGVPAVFHDLPDGLPPNRLALARWLVSPHNPLTARVIVNRYWEQIFGIGIVSTSEEFGSQGELPYHPELLDWLATELVESDWNVKALLRLLVTSEAYCQSSQVSDRLRARDPDNRLLARGPRFRLSAEMIRDQSLAVSGLLSDKMYGPPVNPPQPNLGLKAAFGGATDWKTSRGEDRYRRGVYTSWRRSNPYPSMATFDAPNREVCTIRRDRTNTPLQALVTLNDPAFVEAAQGLARRIAGQPGDVADQAEFGFRLCVARPPTEAETAQLVALFEQAKARLADDADSATKLATEPLGPLPNDADATTLAAWTVVGNVLLNLDEVLMKK